MITPGLSHIGHVVSGLSAAVYQPERAKSAAPVLLTLFGFTPVQVELLIGGFLLAAQSVNLTLRKVKHRFALVRRS